MPMNEEPKWYILHTYSGYENAVAAAVMKAAENRRMTDLINEVRKCFSRSIVISRNALPVVAVEVEHIRKYNGSTIYLFDALLHTILFGNIL